MKKFYGSGYRNCYGGITYGLSRPIGKDTEMVFVEYRRIPQKHTKTLVVDVLNEKLKRELRDDGVTVDVTDAMAKKVQKRMYKWSGQIMLSLETMGK